MTVCQATPSAFESCGILNFVKRQMTIRVMAMLALLSCLLPSFGAGAAWFCEGRQCGTSLWRCCCVSADTLRDSHCSKREDAGNRPASETATVSACPAGCNCVMMSADAPASHAAIAVATLFPPMALLPLSAPVYSVASASEPLLFGKEPRGPPCQLFAFANLSLRAPPVA